MQNTVLTTLVSAPMASTTSTHTNHRSQWPALDHINTDSIERGDTSHGTRQTTISSSLPPVASAMSPTYYPPGPPPPYNFTTAQQSTSWPGKSIEGHTPPDSRRTSDDVEAGKQNTRQPLPSISDVLGVDRPALNVSTTAASVAPLNISHGPIHTSSPSPTTRTLPSLSETTAGNYGRHSSTSTTYHQHDRIWTDDQHSRDITTSSYTQTHLREQSPRNRNGSLPSARALPPHISTSSHMRPRLSPPYNHASPTHSNLSNGASSMMGPPTTPAYVYASYPPPRPTASTFGPGAPPGPIYQPSSNHAPTPWQTEANHLKQTHDGRVIPHAAYGESVKRHLDIFDLEAALNDIATSSGILTDFTRRYGDRLHRSARNGPDMASLPGLVEVDDMVVKSRLQLDALVKIRDVVMTQQAAYEQQIADQRRRKSYDEAHQLAHDGSSEHDDKNGFMSADAKKRRGRAAPPGRCHSCNRAETPEWRRGPDGARTLCNACGLHYAKLTRKQQGNNKNGSVGSSNLRPKSNMGDS